MSKTKLLLAVSLISLVAANSYADAPNVEVNSNEVTTTEATSSEAMIGLQEVVVTAQKRSTSLQKTPISISVLGSKDLENQHIASLEDLMNGGTPSLRVAPFFSRSSAITVGIRGMVPFDANQPSRDATVGVYIDGVYLGRSQGLGAALFDLQRIEVLKGPQGTLFGRNTEGGAVSLVTKRPTGEMGVRSTVGVSNFGGKSFETHIDLPQTAGVSLKIDGLMKTREGTVENPDLAQEDFNKFEKRGVHVAALFEPSDNFEIQWDFDTSVDVTTPYYVQLLERNNAAVVPLSPLVKVQSRREKMADLGLRQEDNEGVTMGHMLHANYKLNDNLDLRYIGSWRKVKQNQLDNSIGAHSGPWRANANFARYSMASLRQSQDSHELQFVGSSGNIKYVGGLYYYHEEGDDDAWTPNTAKWNATGTAYTYLNTLTEGASWAFPDRASTAIAKSYAAFGQFTYSPSALDDKGHLTLGARVTKDEKSGVLSKVNGADVHYTFDISSSHFDPMISFAYDFSKDVHAYAKWGTAYRAGGANSRSVNYRAFDAENVSTYELGLKSEFWQNQARLNIAAYHTDYTDVQIDFSATNLNNSNRGTLETVNAPGNSTIDGVEIDLSVSPFEGFTASLNYAYTKGDMPKAANPFAANALSNVFLVYTPENAASLSLDYEKDLAFAKLSAHIDANFGQGYHGSSSEVTLTDESLVSNARIALSEIKLNKDTQLQVALWSRNVFNEQHTFYESRGSWSVIGAWGMYNEPRTYGIDFSVKY